MQVKSVWTNVCKGCHDVTTLEKQGCPEHLIRCGWSSTQPRSVCKICYRNELRFLLRRDEGVHCGELIVVRPGCCGLILRMFQASSQMKCGSLGSFCNANFS